MPYMFRTILVHHQEQLYKLYIAIWYMPVYADTSSCCVATATRIGIYQTRCTAYKVAPDDGLI